MRSEVETNFILISGLCLLSIGLIFICSQIYLGYFRIRQILQLLSRSRGVMQRKLLTGKDPFSRFVILVSVGAFLTFPDRAIKTGNLDKQDLLGFPIGLYKVIRGLYVLALFGATLLLLVTLVGEISGWM